MSSDSENNGPWETVTGLWERTKNGDKNEKYLYGKPREGVVINKGDEIFIFNSAQKGGPKPGQPVRFMKIKRADGTQEVVEL